MCLDTGNFSTPSLPPYTCIHALALDGQQGPVMGTAADHCFNRTESLYVLSINTGAPPWCSDCSDCTSVGAIHGLTDLLMPTSNPHWGC